MRVTLVLALGLLGCGQDPGQVRLSIEFEQRPDFSSLQTDLYAAIRVEERAEDDRLVRILGQTVPQLYYSVGAPGPTPLALTIDIPHGSGRVIFVELQENDRDDAQTLYFGRSQAFSIEARESKDITATVALVQPPQVTGPDGIAGFEIVGESDGRVASVDVVLRLLVPADAAVVRVSNLSGFPEGAATESISIEAGALSIDVPWNLDRGLSSPCGVADFCQRQVSVQLVNPFGYAGREVSRQVIADTQAPQPDRATVSTRILPPAGSLVPAVARLGVGAEYRVSMGFSEPVRVVPQVVARGDSGDPVPLETVSTSSQSLGTTFTWRVTVPPTIGADGAYTLVVTAVDQVGNEGVAELDAALARFVVDRRAPPVPNAQALTYARAPWGDIGAPSPRFIVSGASGAVEAGASVLFFTSAQVDGATPIARATADEAGAVAPVDLGLTEQPLVYALTVDAAGNPSDAAPNEPGIQAQAVEQTRWTATFNRKVRDQFESNPHLAVQLAAGVAHRIPSDDLQEEPETAVIARLNAIDAQVLSVDSRRRWRRVSPTGWSPRGSAQFGVSPDTGRGVLVGGLFGTTQGFAGDQWFWEQARWLPARSNLVLPTARINGNLVPFPPTGELLLFGGCTGLACASRFNDLWAWDGFEWTERRGLTGRPRPRAESGAVYDSLRRRLLIFSGSSEEDGLESDLWSFDGQRWARLTPGGARVNGLGSGAMAYDEARDEVVVVGTLDNDNTYVFDGRNWILAASAAASPPTRGISAMAYDPKLDRAILYSGATPNGLTRDTWEWNGATRTWRLYPQQVDGPRPRYGHPLAYDEALGKIVMAGGCARGQRVEFGITCAEDLRDTWTWEGDRWRRLSDAGIEPPATGGYDMAFRRLSGQTVLFGGCSIIDPVTGANCNRYEGTTWTFNGATWTPQFGPGPQARALHGMANLSAFNEVVLFGGASSTDTTINLLSDTWVYGDSGWSPVAVAGPPARGGQAMAEDAARRRVLLFGGTTFIHFPPLVNGMFNDLWAWTGTAWTPIVPATSARPSGRAFPSMAVDPVRNKLVMFGGFANITGLLAQNPIPGLWEFDFGTQQWTAVSTGATAPEPRGLATMFWDENLQEVVLVGGTNAQAVAFNDVWSWNGSRWAQIGFAGRTPAGTAYGRVVFDSTRQEIVRFGGLSTAGLENETWVTDLAPQRPEVRFTFDLSSAAVREEEIEGWTLSVFAGGAASRTGGAALEGVSVDVWDAGRGRFLPVASSDAGLGQPAMFEARQTGTAAQRALTGDQKLVFRVRPVAESEAVDVPATIAVDAVKVSVDYRRPRPVCGNGRVESFAGEACDDGNTDDGDFCSPDCQPRVITHERGANDDVRTAQAVGTLGPDWTIVAGDVFPANDVDYWALSIPGDARLEAQVVFDLANPDQPCTSRHDSRLSLRDAGDGVVVQSDDVGASRCPAFTTGVLPEGAYFLEIAHQTGTQPVEPYYIRVRLLEP